MLRNHLRNPNETDRTRWTWALQFSTDGEHWTDFRVREGCGFDCDDSTHSDMVTFYRDRPHLCDLAGMPRVS